ncbi:MAG: hypothetical protein IH840_10685 [Candidatus Heimdallarchaeota archaeon]|nr:hypothetical protein [Candidatus Heimdallarchaeota archaeon]
MNNTHDDDLDYEIVDQDDNKQPPSLLGMFDDINVTDGRISLFGDGIADLRLGLVKITVELFVNTPIRVLSRTADGALQGRKKGRRGIIGGIVKGTIKGLDKSIYELGSGITAIGTSFGKLSNALIPEKKLNM